MFWTPSNVFVEVGVGDVSLYHSFSHLRSLLGAYLICMSSPTQNCLEKSLVAEAAWRAQRAFRTPTPTRTASHITGIGQFFRHHEQQAQCGTGCDDAVLSCVPAEKSGREQKRSEDMYEELLADRSWCLRTVKITQTAFFACRDRSSEEAALLYTSRTTFVV